MSDTVDLIYINHDDIKFLFGKRESLLLIYDSFIYKRENGNFPKTSWRCTTKGCSKSVSTFNGKFQDTNKIIFHEHPQPTDEIILLETNMRIKNRVETEFNLTPKQIHAEERMHLLLRGENSAYLKMESFDKVKRNLYRYRTAKFPMNPKERNEVILYNEWALTLDKRDDFLLANDGNEDKILIFGTESNLRILCNAEFVVSDGTFSVNPDIFAQFYVFHAPYLGKVLPLLFCLLPDKTFNTYIRLLRLIKNAASKIGSRFDPKKFHIDYELAMINAISDIFSKDRVQGCLFHFSQCIWRRVQELGLSVPYKKYKHIKEWIRRLTALPFLPLTDIDDGFIEIVESSPDAQNGIITQDQIDKMHGYMLRTWLMETNAKFDRTIWNQFQNEGPRTTNNAEGWNNKLNQLAKSRLSFYQFVYLLQKLQVDLDACKFDLISESPSSRRNKYTIVNESIQTAKLNYTSGSVPLLSYLDSVSIAIKLD